VFRGTTSVKVTEWATANAWAQARSGEHEAGVIDRSDKESGLLRTMLGQ
jgi:hypothetical protein